MRSRRLKTGFPTVLTFEVDEQQMNQLKVLRFDAYTFEWAQFILMNRRNDTNKPMHDYDIVYGPIANDSPPKGVTDRQSWLTN
jgi:hypothetical protein